MNILSIIIGAVIGTIFGFFICCVFVGSKTVDFQEEIMLLKHQLMKTKKKDS